MITYQRYQFQEVRTSKTHNITSTLTARLRFPKRDYPYSYEEVRQRLDCKISPTKHGS